MTVDFTKPVLQLSGGSYVVMTKEGLPYNILPDDKLNGEVQKWLSEGNKATPYVPPVAPPPDPAVKARADLQAMLLQYVNGIVNGQDIVKDIAPEWTAAWKAVGN